jgi:hypothetical protein
MKILDMHYDFKRKFNVLDTSARRSFQTQEIDWFLNEAQYQFVLSRLDRQSQGLSEGQRNLDDLRTLFKDLTAPVTNNEAFFPPDQLVSIKIEAKVTKQGCGTKVIRVYNMAHDDTHERDTFVQSSFEWEELNAEYRRGKLLLFPTDFTVEEVYFTYVKNPPLMYYALQPYRLPSGDLLSGIVDCELPEHTHHTIVDFAVAGAMTDLSGDLQSRYQKMTIQ